MTWRASRREICEQPSVFDGYDGLGCEVLYQRDLLVCERSNFFAVDGQCSEQCFVFAKSYNKGGPSAAEVYNCSTERVAKPIGILVLLIAVDKVLALNKSPMCISWPRLIHSHLKVRSKSIWHVSLRGALKTFSVVGRYEPERGLAKVQGFVEDCEEYRL